MILFSLISASILNKSRIILIETSTAVCSVALAEGTCAADARIIASRVTSEPRAHAAKTAAFVQEVLQECGLGVSDCSAVCVSSGPGSYTGLRVGSSSAKGLCFGARLPLLAMGTLDILAWQALEACTAMAGAPDICADGCVPDICGDGTRIVPMIDARRMEVYSAVYQVESSLPENAGSPEAATGRTLAYPQRISPVEPLVLTEDSFAKLLSNGNVCFIGDGAAKFEKLLADSGLLSPETCSERGIHFIQTNPLATSMVKGAFLALEKEAFENTAYFEPFYLKDFVATVSKKTLF